MKKFFKKWIIGMILCCSLIISIGLNVKEIISFKMCLGIMSMISLGLLILTRDALFDNDSNYGKYPSRLKIHYITFLGAFIIMLLLFLAI